MESFTRSVAYDLEKIRINTYLSWKVLKKMVGSNLKDTQLQQIVDKTVRSLDQDHDGKISFEEFCKIVNKSEFDKKMSLSVTIWGQFSTESNVNMHFKSVLLTVKIYFYRNIPPSPKIF